MKAQSITNFRRTSFSIYLLYFLILTSMFLLHIVISWENEEATANFLRIFYNLILQSLESNGTIHPKLTAIIFIIFLRSIETYDTVVGGIARFILKITFNLFSKIEAHHCPYCYIIAFILKKNLSQEASFFPLISNNHIYPATITDKLLFIYFTLFCIAFIRYNLE